MAIKELHSPHDRTRPATDASWLPLNLSALGTFPSPVLTVDAEGRVTPLNEAARLLSAAINDTRVPALSAAVARSLVTGRCQVDVVLLPGAAGASVFEVNVLPAAEGAALVLAKDVTLENNLRTALAESRQRYKGLVEISSDFAWEVGPDGGFTFVSPRGALGYPADQLVGRRPDDFLLDEAGDGIHPFTASSPVEDEDIWMRCVDGSVVCLQTSATPLFDGDGNKRGALGVCRDVTREREHEQALAAADNRERLLNYIVRTIGDVVDPGDMLATAAEAASRAMGGVACQIFRLVDGAFIPSATVGEPGESSEILDTFEDYYRFEGEVGGRMALGTVTRYRQDVNGAIIVWRVNGNLSWNDDERILVEDVSNQIAIANEQIANHERIVTLSRTDSLTRLFNRRAFFEELTRRFSRLAHEKKAAALIYVDLDNFKLVNDVHGHRQGDEALLAVRDILLSHTRPIDLLARLGGDEFAIWLESADQRIASKRCQALVSAAQQLAKLSGSPDFPLTMSLGVAVYDPDIPETLDDLVSRADEAMYEAKRDGKGNFRMAPHGAGRGQKTP